MKPICKTLTVPHTADIHFTPDGRFVYGSNRGHETIVGYRCDKETGELSSPSWIDIDGSIPRNFGISPDGNFLLVACQDTHTVNTFKIMKDTGLLVNTGHKVHVPSPVCVCFAPEAYK